MQAHGCTEETRGLDPADLKSEVVGSLKLISLFIICFVLIIMSSHNLFISWHSLIVSIYPSLQPVMPCGVE